MNDKRWAALIRYTLMKEGLSLFDEKGARRRSLPEVIRGKRILPGVFPTARDLDETDIILAMAAYSREKPKVTVKAQSYLHIIGKYRKNGSASVALTLDGKEVPLRITYGTLWEKDVEESDPEQILHFIGEKSVRKRIKFVISDEVYRLVTKYWFGSEVENTLEDFFQLHNAQRLIKRVLLDRETARSILYFLSFAVSRAAVGQDIASDEAIMLAVNDFNKKRYDCHPVSAEDIIGLLDEQESLWDYFLPLNDGRWATHYFSRFLVCFAVANGLCPQEGTVGDVFSELIPKGDIRTARKIVKILPYLCGEGKYITIMEDILAKCKVQPYNAGSMELMLYEALIYQPFNISFVERAAGLLFKDSIAYFQINDVPRLLDGENGEKISRYVFQQFWKCLEQREAAYNYVCAAILNATSSTDPVEDAVLYADEGDLLLNCSRIALNIWQHLDEGQPLTNKSDLFENFAELLLDKIRTYDKLFYSTCASAIHDLVLLGDVSTERINEPAIYQTALSALNEEDGKLWSERLLSILPWEDREIPETVNVDELRQRYLERLERELRKEDESCEPEVTFSLLHQLGYEESPLERIERWQTIQQYYFGCRNETVRRRKELIKNCLFQRVLE